MFKKLLPLLIFSLIYVAGAAHKWFPDDPSKKYNLILFEPRPMTMAWNVGYIANQVVIPLLMVTGISLIIKRSKVDEIYKKEFKVYKWFTILNSISYFLIYNSGVYYSWIYWLLAIIAIIIWISKKSKSEDIN